MKIVNKYVVEFNGLLWDMLEMDGCNGTLMYAIVLHNEKCPSIGWADKDNSSMLTFGKKWDAMLKSRLVHPLSRGVLSKYLDALREAYQAFESIYSYMKEANDEGAQELNDALGRLYLGYESIETVVDKINDRSEHANI